MKKKNIGIMVTMHLGWKTYYRQIETVAKNRDDVNIHMVPTRLDILGRLLTYDIPFTKNTRLVDPLYAFRRITQKSLKDHTPKNTNLDLIHAASHLSALSIYEKKIPYSLGVDQTRINSINDFNNTHFSEKSLNDERNLIKDSLYIQALNDWAQKSLITDYEKPEDKIQLAYPSVVSDKFNVRKHEDQSGKVKILFIGNDIYRKGGDRLMKWHHEHFSDNTELHLISNQADKLGPAKKNQFFYPRIEYNDIVNKVLPEMDLFVLPTEYDMSPYAAVEAAATGLPLVVSKMAGTAYICRDNVNGFCLDYSDENGFIEKIKTLISDKALRTTMGLESRKIVETEFDAAKNYNRLIDSLKVLA